MIHKQELRDALRLATQSAIAASATLAVMQAAELPEKYVGVLSAAFVIQPSRDNSVTQAGKRFEATIFGSLVGLFCLLATPRGFGPLLALATAMFLVNFVTSIKSEWRYAIVAAAALALSADGNAYATAVQRGSAIGIGVVAGALSSLLLWGEPAKCRAERSLRAALEEAAKRFKSAVDEVQGVVSQDEKTAAISRYHRSIESARRAAAEVRLDDDNELSLKIDLTERVYNSAIIVNRAAEKSGTHPSVRPALLEDVSEMRTLACRTAYAVVDGTMHQKRLLQELGQRVATFRERLRDQERSDSQAHLENVLLFGFEEISHSLTEVVERRP